MKGMTMPTIRFDAAAAWRLRESGWHTDEWMHEMREHGDFRDDDQDIGFVSWRLKTGGSPGGSWFSRFDVQIGRNEGQSATRFDRITLVRDQAFYIACSRPFANGPTRLLVRTRIPETAMIASVGRDATCVLDHPALAGSTILDARSIDETSGSDALSEFLLDPARVDVEMPIMMWR